MKCGTMLGKAVEDGFQRWICPDCGWTFYNNPRPCVTALIHDRHRFLFIRRSKAPGEGLWDFPGGFMEAHEHPDTALKREIREELNSELASYRLIGFYPDAYDETGTIPLLNIAYLCRIRGDINQSGDEFSEIRWLSHDNPPIEFAFRSMMGMLKDASVLPEILQNE
ncbi:NUDIX hydrolase [bacterium]|nr:NUDIX hydrolase [bacterium]